MPKARKLIGQHGISLLVVVALASLWLGWRLLAPEPSFQGKTAAEWFQEMPMDKRGLGNALLQALRQCRPSALPFLCRMAQKQDNLWTKTHRRLRPWLPALVQQWLPLPSEPAAIRYKAIMQVLPKLAPGSKDIVPVLIQGLSDREQLVPRWAIHSPQRVRG